MKNEVVTEALELQEIFNLTDFEALQIACNLVQMDMYKRANVVMDKQLDYPTALEKIATHLDEIASK